MRLFTPIILSLCIGVFAARADETHFTSAPANPAQPNPEQRGESKAGELRDLFNNTIDVTELGMALAALNGEDSRKAWRAANWFLDNAEPLTLNKLLASPDKMAAAGILPAAQKYLVADAKARAETSADKLLSQAKDDKLDPIEQAAAQVELFRRNLAPEVRNLSNAFKLGGAKAIDDAGAIKTSLEDAKKVLHPLLADLTHDQLITLKQKIDGLWFKIKEQAKEKNGADPEFEKYLTNFREALKAFRPDTKNQPTKPRNNQPRKGQNNAHVMNLPRARGTGGNQVRSRLQGGGGTAAPRRYTGNQGQRVRYPQPATPDKGGPVENKNYEDLKIISAPVRDGDTLDISEGEYKDTCFISDTGEDSTGALGNFQYMFDGVANEYGGMHETAQSGQPRAFIAAVQRCYAEHLRTRPQEPFHITVASHGSPGQNQLIHLNNIDDITDALRNIPIDSISLLSCSTGAQSDSATKHIQLELAEKLKANKAGTIGTTVVAYDDLLHVSPDRLTVDGCIGVDANMQTGYRQQCQQVHKITAQFNS